MQHVVVVGGAAAAAVVFVLVAAVIGGSHGRCLKFEMVLFSMLFTLFLLVNSLFPCHILLCMLCAPFGMNKIHLANCLQHVDIGILYFASK